MSDHIEWMRRPNGNVAHGTVDSRNGRIPACRPNDTTGSWIDAPGSRRCKVCEAVFTAYPEMENPDDYPLVEMTRAIVALGEGK